MRFWLSHNEPVQKLVHMYSTVLQDLVHNLACGVQSDLYPMDAENDISKMPGYAAQERILRRFKRVFVKEIWIRPMSSSATWRVANRWGTWGSRSHSNRFKTTFYPPAKMEYHLCLQRWVIYIFPWILLNTSHRVWLLVVLSWPSWPFILENSA